MWQDSGRYEWPLLQAPGEQTTAPATQTVLPAYDSQSLVLNPYPTPAAAEIAALRAEVETLRARVVELEQAAERHAGTL